VKKTSSTIAQQVAELSDLSRNMLTERWRSLYLTEPPHNSSRKFLRGAIAYRLQERAFGGLQSEIRRLLERAAVHAGQRKSLRVESSRKALPGTVLLREWHGVRHQVTVLDHGAVYRGERYRSLSEIARVITGSKWSGPLFFGLKPTAKDAHQ
jgi:Protein of unknown function (DUF2924)